MTRTEEIDGFFAPFPKFFYWPSRFDDWRQLEAFKPLPQRSKWTQAQRESYFEDFKSTWDEGNLSTQNGSESFYPDIYCMYKNHY
jgi:hypothetical protein